MKLTLTKLKQEHLEKVRLWRNSDHIAKYMISNDYISTEQQIEWFNKIKDNKTQEYFIIEANNNPIGLLSFVDIDSHNKTSSWGFYLGDTNYHSKGIGSKIMSLGIEYAFNNLKLKKLNAQILSFNKKSIDLHIKYGFKQETTIKNKITKDKKSYDLILMGLCSKINTNSLLIF